VVSDFLTRLPEIDAVVKAGVPTERIYTDKKWLSGRFRGSGLIG